MNTRKTVEITLTALELVVERGRLSTSEVINCTDSSVSKSETETILLHLEDIGWVKQSNEEPPMWKLGSSGSEYLDSTNIDHHTVRVLPDEVPEDEQLR